MKIIKRLRDERRMTLQQVSDATGLSMGLINGYELGTMSNPKFKTVKALAELFEDYSDELFKEAGRIPSDIFYRITQSRLSYSEIRKALNDTNI